jgi:hypothetical protein
MVKRDDALEEKALKTLNAWIGSPNYKEKRTGEILRYAVCAGLAVCEHAKYSFPLREADYITDKNQVKTGGPFIKEILGRFGIEKTYAREGGRTTRGTVPAALALANRLNRLSEIQELPDDIREALFASLQKSLVELVRDFFSRCGIRFFRFGHPIYQENSCNRQGA